MNNQSDSWLTVFEEAKPRLEGLAYRILGTVSEAEDVVQDTFIKWQNTDRGSVKSPQAWLTTVCTRRALDLLKAAHRERVSYFGTWLPEPLHTETTSSVEGELELANSLSTAFLLLLERLSPKERAAYLLHDVFDTDYTTISEMLEMAEPAVRKLVSRARGHIKSDRVRFQPEKEIQERLLEAFQGAIDTGEIHQLESLLAEDVQLHADGGGKVIAVSRVLTEQKHILKFISSVLHNGWKGSDVSTVMLNDQLGLVFRFDGKIHTAVSFAYNQDGALTDLYLMRNPDKLESLEKRLTN